MIIELHLLQSFPVSNLNRDDVGQPKTATFGGSTRGRISSQCLKRSARQLFTKHGLDEAETGVRTKRLRNDAAAVLVDRGRDAETAPGVVTAGLERLGFGVDQAKGLTEYLLFVGRIAITHLADYCDANWDTLLATSAGKNGKKPAKAKPSKEAAAEAKRMLDATRVADVALFGRMIADNKDFNVDAASQVAHALSTHSVATEFDFYTAVDDLKPEAESGADMIGTVDFNSACYYRYANLDLDRLRTNLAGDDQLAIRAAAAWLGAFIHAVPSGKQNSTAARTMPSTLLGVVRETGAWNLANAFLKPVTDADLIAGSTTRLTTHFQQLRGFYGNSGIRAAIAASVTGDIPHAEHIDTAVSIDQFTSGLLTAAGAATA
ncbi:type I-E CRISPR-associated protein Cas7/Cse4/CasC [Amycolatopsis sp. EV170708-02-1]|uniref:type I-E CRISPR-associated protein Cas7/Cse4/CasC n=1 Tax=Amycolatopsis sp. EV170708-02-1 TaxID=2919322 RepID=UPI001F0C1B78|nr:type I-E CRISPR-associated protein Cas7/Cse4/CasC [Amycolatopsis sp. EV170708-02-1]UMP07064.1 type I-E CRISPR-associated protein Cas7/Cse4/CasC [Amycolatopsis sp. EV170708-02-1]